MRRLSKTTRLAGRLVMLWAGCGWVAGHAPAATVTWVGGTNGNDWFTAANWSPARVPGVLDDVVAGSFSSATLSIPGAAAVHDLRFFSGWIGGGGTLDVTGLATFGDPPYNVVSAVLRGTTVNLGGGARQLNYLAIGGTVNNLPGSTFEASEHGFQASGVDTGLFANAGNFHVDLGAGHTAQINIPLLNSGTVTVASGQLLMAGGGRQTGTFSVQGNGVLAMTNLNLNSSVDQAPFTFAEGSRLINDGAFVGLGGLVLGGSQLQYSGRGALLASFGDFTVDLPSAVDTRLIQVQYSGSLILRNGALADALRLSSGSLSGRVVVSGTAEFGSGAYSDSPMIAAGADVLLKGGAQLRTVQLQLEGILTNDAGSTFESMGLVSGGSLYGGSIGGNGTFVNLGRFVQDAGNAQGDIIARLENRSSGVIELRSGQLALGAASRHEGLVTIANGSTLQFRRSDHLFEPGSVVRNDGRFEVAGGQVQVGGALSGPGSIVVSAGQLILNAQAALTAGSLSVTGGSVDLRRGELVTTALSLRDGRITIQPGAKATVAGPDAARIDSGELQVIGELSAAQVVVTDGRLLGFGRINGDVTLSNTELVAFGLQVAGDLALGPGPNGKLLLGRMLPAPTTPLLSVDGSLRQGGVLSFSVLTGNTTPTDPIEWDLVTYGSTTGAFDRIEVFGLDADFSWTLAVGEHAIHLSATPVPELPTGPMAVAGVLALFAAGARRRSTGAQC